MIDNPDSETVLRLYERIERLERQLAEAQERNAELEQVTRLLDRRLLIDVILPPGTRIKAGCKIKTVVSGLSSPHRSTDAAIEDHKEQSDGKNDA